MGCAWQGLGAVEFFAGHAAVLFDCSLLPASMRPLLSMVIVQIAEEEAARYAKRFGVARGSAVAAARARKASAPAPAPASSMAQPSVDGGVRDAGRKSSTGAGAGGAGARESKDNERERARTPASEAVRVHAVFVLAMCVGFRRLTQPCRSPAT